MTKEQLLEEQFEARLKESELLDRIRKAKLLRFLQRKSVEEEEALRKRGLCPHCRTFLPANGICDCR